jgi:hypothetical protein
MDFRLRCIPPKPRDVAFSNAFPKALPEEVSKALEHLTSLIKVGGDLNPYQSTGLTLYNDSSGNKKSKRTDLLWADWGITHLHLTNDPIRSGSYFSDRKDWLLFGIVSDTMFGAVDVRRHEKGIFSNIDLIRTVAESWPDVMKRYELVGIAASNENLSSEEYGKLRRAGIMCHFSFNGKCYLGPGMGVTTAATALRAGLAEDHVWAYLNDLSQLVLDQKFIIGQEIASKGIVNPNLRLKTSSKGIAIVEESLNKAWILPYPVNGQEQDYLAKLHDLILPSWMLPQIENFDLN